MVPIIVGAGPPAAILDLVDLHEEGGRNAGREAARRADF